MPIYEYCCPKCQKVFEEWVKLADAHSEEACPDCGTMSPRMISHTSFVLKGGGWYVTEYGNRKGIKEDGTQETPKESTAKAENTTKKETTTAAKDAAKPAEKAQPAKSVNKTTTHAAAS